MSARAAAHEAQGPRATTGATPQPQPEPQPQPQPQPQTDVLRLERQGGVLVATLARPPVNALDDALLAALDAALERAGADDAVSVLHLRSDQRAFCAGADLAFMAACFDAPHGSDAMADLVRRMQRVFARLEAAPVVTLAEIGGSALGGGFELALACDLRLAAHEARIGLPEAGLGLLHAARPAAELPAFARAWAARQAALPRHALAASKRCIAAAFDRARDGYAEEVAETRALYDHPETRRRVAEFLARRAR